MAPFNNSKYPGGRSFDNVVIQSLMGRLQLGPSYPGSNPLLSQSLDDFLSQGDELRPDDDEDDDDEGAGPPHGHGRGREQSRLAREEARLEKEIIRIVRSGSALDALKPNTGQSVAIGDHSVCVGYHEEPGSEYRIWEWHGHIMLFDEENGYSPEYIYGNYFERIPADSGEAKRGDGGGVSGGEDEDEKKENGVGNSGLRDLISEQKDSASNGGGRVLHRNSLNTGLSK